jgi:hypothetical protein
MARFQFVHHGSQRIGVLYEGRFIFFLNIEYAIGVTVQCPLLQAVEICVQTQSSSGGDVSTNDLIRVT